MNKKEEKLAVLLLLEKLNKEVTLIETPVVKKAPAVSQEELQLESLIKKYTSMSTKLEKALQPFYEQIDAINETIAQVTGDKEENLTTMSNEIYSLMEKLGLEVKIVNKAVAKFEYQEGRQSWDRKKIIEQIRALDGFMDQYGKASDEIMEANHKLAQATKYLSIQKESRVVDNILGIFSKKIKEVFFLIYNGLKTAVSGLGIQAQKVEQAFA